MGKKLLGSIFIFTVLTVVGCGSQTTASAEQIAESVSGMPESIQQTSKPVRQTPKPTEEPSEPIHQTPKPTEEASEPVRQTPKPTEGASEPVRQTPKTIEEASESIRQTPKPTEEASEPIHQMPKPAEESPESTQQTTEAVQETVKPTGGTQDGGNATTAEEHNYVTETTAATCTKAECTKIYCSICGSVQSESESGYPTGHFYEKNYFPEAPTCTHGGSYTEHCTVCGAIGSSGTDPDLPHKEVYETICQGDCTNPTVVVTTCSECGFELNRIAFNESIHDWLEGTYEEYDPVADEVIIKSIIRCSRCYILQQ